MVVILMMIKSCFLLLQFELDEMDEDNEDDDFCDLFVVELLVYKVYQEVVGEL